MNTYYGQFETDRLIAEYFPQFYVGKAVEVGASHGTVSSNTLHFEQKGWDVLCIEPNPALYNQLKNNRKNTLKYAIADYNMDDMPFFVVTIVGGDQTAVSGLRLDEKLLQAHQVYSQAEILVPVRTMDFTLSRHFNHKLDFVSIDTEGTELDVLKGFDLAKWQPKLLVIENNFETPYIEDYLKDKGYRKDKRHVINDFYVSEHYYTFD